MNRAAFDHAVRAAGAVLGVTEILVVGSQAIHGSLKDDLPVEAERSIEVDLVPFDDPHGEGADLIDGSIGEASPFHQTFGYYAQGVSESTSVLPDGWRERLVRYDSKDTRGVVAWCLEPHDLWVAKAVAGRPKDIEFCRALVAIGLVDRRTLAARLDGVTNLDEPRRARVATLIGRS